MPSKKRINPPFSPTAIKNLQKAQTALALLPEIVECENCKVTKTRFYSCAKHKNVLNGLNAEYCRRTVWMMRQAKKGANSTEIKLKGQNGKEEKILFPDDFPEGIGLGDYANDLTWPIQISVKGKTYIVQGEEEFNRIEDALLNALAFGEPLPRNP